ncbi:MAG: xanthine dehydrogenase small subunit [Sedimentitalea sp.]
MNITFLLNGETVALTGVAPTDTLLDWLRDDRGATGTKEGCNEGDCGACSVMITDTAGRRALNACILFLPQLDGKAVRTVEGISGPEGRPHPVQQAMIDHHGSQCGFCTPGIITTMATAHANGARDDNDQLAGNLCRCTGYAPIIRAAQAARKQPVPNWIHDTPPAPSDAQTPSSSDALAKLYIENPNATLIAGATDVGLWVTKGLRDLPSPIFLHRCDDLKTITQTDTTIDVGAMVTMASFRKAIAPIYPSYSELLRRYGSQQVREAATLGGNIANGSPIGDNAPALIALGAQLGLRKGDTTRTLDIEDFFIAYGQQDCAPGEFVTGVSIPKDASFLQCYKISKRFDQDISALCGCFNITVQNNHISVARIAFGGMAGIPKRAHNVENALIGQPWTTATITTAQKEFAHDFKPLGDMRASADYRLGVARSLLMRYFAQSQGATVSVLDVTA